MTSILKPVLKPIFKSIPRPILRPEPKSLLTERRAMVAARNKSADSRREKKITRRPPPIVEFHYESLDARGRVIKSGSLPPPREAPEAGAESSPSNSQIRPADSLMNPSSAETKYVSISTADTSDELSGPPGHITRRISMHSKKPRLIIKRDDEENLYR